MYGRDVAFLTGLEERAQVLVGEIPANFHRWLRKPKVLREAPQNAKSGHRKRYPRLAAGCHSSEVQALVKHSPVFHMQAGQLYRVKDTNTGPQAWEVKWALFWRKDQSGLPTRRHCLIVARSVLTKEVKYFLSNRVPGERNPVTGKWITLRWLLWVAFNRWPIEDCFRTSKQELGMDHYEVRGWSCLHRHFHLTQWSYLFCARIRQKYDESDDAHEDRITVRQVRSAMNVWLETATLPRSVRRERFEDEIRKQQYYQRRNRQARQSHTKTRIAKLKAMGIDVDKIKSCIPRRRPPDPQPAPPP